LFDVLEESMDKDTKEIVDALDSFVENGKTCPAFSEDEWAEIAELWAELKDKLKRQGPQSV
jgi:hypothetical protein